MINKLLSYAETKSMATNVAWGIFASSLALASNLAVADELREWSIDLNGLSQHSDSRYTENGVSRKYNETNQGLGASIEWPDWHDDLFNNSRLSQWIQNNHIDADIKFGFFENSYRKTSFYAGTFFHKDFGSQDWKFAPGIALLLTTGYEDTPENAPAVFPLPVFGVELGHRAFKLNIGYVPWGEVDFATVQLQLVPAYW